MVGVILAIGYALVQSKLPGSVVVRGALYGVAPWLVAQVMVIPIMGLGFFQSLSQGLASPTQPGHLGTQYIITELSIVSPEFMHQRLYFLDPVLLFHRQ